MMCLAGCGRAPGTPGSPAWAEEGVLQIYDSRTQISTIARRDRKDAEGRIARETYYTYRRGFSGHPRDERDLEIQSVRVFAYADGRKVWLGVYWRPHLKLSSTTDFFYDESGQEKMSQTRDAEGVLIMKDGRSVR
jgi:hypothetical protein